jgi:soluble lytic murein transglycosylase
MQVIALTPVSASTTAAETALGSTTDETILYLKKKSRALAAKTELEAQKATTRWHHAKELLGKNYNKSVVRTGEGLSTIDDVLYQWVKRDLKGQWKKNAKQVSQAILKESENYGFDPIFLIAIIQAESSFNPEVIGPCGEIGLMQLTAQTAEWIAKKYDIAWKGTKSLTNPIINIKIGAAYIAYLREKFEFKSQLYLSAYNMGSSNVIRAVEKQIWPKEYASRVMQRYVNFYTELKEEIEKSVN